MAKKWMVRKSPVAVVTTTFGYEVMAGTQVLASFPVNGQGFPRSAEEFNAAEEAYKKFDALYERLYDYRLPPSGRMLITLATIIRQELAIPNKTIARALEERGVIRRLNPDPYWAKDWEVIYEEGVQGVCRESTEGVQHV